MHSACNPAIPRWQAMTAGGRRPSRPPLYAELLRRRVVKMRDHGMSLRDIGKTLNSDGVETPAGRPHWHTLMWTGYSARSTSATFARSDGNAPMQGGAPRQSAHSLTRRSVFGQVARLTSDHPFCLRGRSARTSALSGFPVCRSLPR